MKTQDEQHLDILSILHYVYGGLLVLGGFFPLLYVGMGVLFVSGGLTPKNSPNPPPPPAIGYVFIVIGVVACLIIWMSAGLMVLSGRYLARRKNRTFCLIIAGISCLNMPLGTILGVFTIIVLMKERVVILFDGPASDAGYLEALPPDREDVRVIDHPRRHLD
jgi:hypothetical protein